MTREEYELQRDMIEWLMGKGYQFNEAISLVSYHLNSGKEFICAVDYIINFNDVENQIKKE